MKEKLLALVAGSLSALSPAFAQYTDLLNDRNIIWVAEYTADYSLNPVTYSYRFFDDNYYEPNNELNIIELRMQPKMAGLYEQQDLEQYFSQKVFKGMLDGAFALFEDELLEIPLPGEKLAERLVRTDTVVARAPDGYEEPDFDIVRNEVTNDQIVAFRVRQVFFFNKTEKKFGSRILALAPLLDKRDENGNYLETQPIAWLKIDAPAKNREKVLPGEFAYVFETKMRGNAPGLQGFVAKKGRFDFLTLIVNEVAKPSQQILDNNFQAIDPAKLQDYVLSVDTLTTFNPETYEEKTEIIQRNAIKDVERIGFVQQWFYDDRQKLFFNRIVAVVPLMNVKDKEGNFQYSRPLFYIMNE